MTHKPYEVINSLSNWGYTNRFECLLFSLIGMFILNIFFPVDIYSGTAQAVYLPIQIAAGLNLFGEKQRLRLYGVILVSVVVLGGRLLDIFAPINITNEMGLLYIAFFGLVMIEVFRQLYNVQVVNAQIIFAAICGYLLIGYCGYFAFTVIEFNTPGAFVGLQSGKAGSNDLFYFSYITMLTVGYGDITPLSWVARNAAIVVALTGYIYSLIVIGLVVNRFGATVAKKSANSSTEESSS